MSETPHVSDATEAPGVELRLPAAVLWDMDGTLVDTEPYWFASERDLVDRYGHGDWPDHHAHAMVGFDLLDSAAYMQEHGGVDLPAEEIVDRLLDGVIARLHRKIPWRPGARELLADLNEAGVPCALVTMSWRRFVDPVLAALPARSFVASITGDELPRGRGKPHPDPYQLGAEACGAFPEDCLAIEDSPTGIRSAIDAGCRVIGVPNVKALAREPGLTIVESLDDLRVRDLAEIMSAPDDVPPRAVPFDLDRRRLAYVAAAVAVLLAAVIWLMSGGDEPEPIELPPGAIPVDVWAPYWTLGDIEPIAELRLDEIREASPFWFGARGVDEIVVDENASTELTSRFVDTIGETAALFVPSIRDQMPAGEMAAILADPTTRTQHVDTIMEFARDLDVDGIDLDYEQFAFADGRDTWAATRPDWVAFVSELADELHAEDMTLTVSIPPVWGLPEDVIAAADDARADQDDQDDDGSPTTVPIDTADGYWVYDHGAIAEVVDAIRIMAYDYSVAEPGPIAPIWWVADAVASTSAVVPAEHHDKLVLGVPSYGSNWVVTTLGDCPATAEGKTNVTARSVIELAELRGATPVFDPSTAEWSFTYALTVEDATASCVQNRQVHWVDAEGVGARTEVARRAGWGGVALWALGYEDDDVWQSMLSASRDPLAAAAAD
jgi:HAD superfamily hydrolase (TIGR01509 family)